MDNLDNFLSAPAEIAETQPVETTEVTAPETPQETQPETEAQKQERERDEKGRFKAKETEDPVMVPLKALHETRDEVKALKAELERLRQPQQTPEPTPVPDMFENPEGFTGHLQNQIAMATLNTTLNLSEEMTRASAGSETVDAAQQWGREAFAANPSLYQQFISQRNPYGFLVAEYQRHQVMSQISDPNEVQAYLAWKEAQSKAQAQPSQETAQPAIPNTLADAQSARGSTDALHVPSLDEILGRKA